MDTARCIALIVTVFICAMPLKKGNMLMNEITPAPPPEHLSDMIGCREKYHDINHAAKTNSAAKTVIVDRSLPTNEKAAKRDSNDNAEHKHEEEPLQEIPGDLENKNRSKLKSIIARPICKYGFEEIFLFKNLNLPLPKEAKNFVFVHDKNVENEEIVAAELESSERNKQEKPNMVDDKKTGIAEGDEAKDMKWEVDSMQSFEEWKSLKLQQQEERKAEELLTPPIVRAKKTQVNYASQDCGAKILGHNKEAKHVSAILDENRDLYMLNPCSASIWFVIEMCEPIQVQQLQLCNLELFSSAPKDFTVSVSERYPAREWHNVGTFHASNDRNLQTFTPQTEEQMFAKYIKFEMLNHFSSEHFCPLTLVRVLGVSMVDEFDEAEQSNKDDISEEGSLDSAQQEGNKGENGAINTVINMVKNAVDHVLSNGAKEEDSASKGQSESRVDGEESHDANDSIDPLLESEVVLVINETEIASTSENNSQTLVTLVETGKGEDITEFFKNFSYCPPQRNPLYIPKLINIFRPLSKKLNVHMCWFIEFFCKVSLAGCLVHYPYNYSCMGVFVPLSNVRSSLLSQNEQLSKDKDQITVETNVTVSEVNETVIDSVLQPGVIVEGSSEKQGSEPPGQNISEVPDTGQTSRKDESPLEPASDDISSKSSLTVENSASTATSLGDGPQLLANSEKNEALTSKGTESYNNDKTEKNIVLDLPITDNGILNGPAVKSDGESPRHTLDEDAADVATNRSDENQPNNVPEAVVHDGKITLNITLNVTDVNSANSSLGSNNSNSQPTVVINPGTNQKDSVFMRLSNRIRALEQNMSLSSDYLETLSQRYKKQMDEMQRAFNQTTSKLLSTGRTANENDARQTELIQMAQAEIKMLTGQLQNLSLSHDQLNMQLIGRHACIILLELCIFIVLMTLLGRRMAQVHTDLQRVEEMDVRLQLLVKEFEGKTGHKNLTPNGHCARRDIKLKRRKNRHSHTGGKVSGNSLKNGSAVRKHELSSSQKYTIVSGSRMSSSKCLNQPKSIEVIDKDPRWSVSNRQCNGGQADWNGHSLAIKIPNGHAKGRK